MALKKSDLYASLWASCDELRGGMDASQYKYCVLFMPMHPLYLPNAIPPQPHRVNA